MPKNSLCGTSRYQWRVQVSTSLTRGGMAQLSSAGKMDSEASTENSAKLELPTQLKLFTGGNSTRRESQKYVRKDS